ncbi:hypothetical protein [Clostridium botulinum]|uniref:hypothetical protein n=1 Tax=Clostridium botulinum TaxID=1491 RepID=UPI003DA55862
MKKQTIELTLSTSTINKIRELSYANGTTMNETLKIALKKWNEKNKESVEESTNTLKRLSFNIDFETAKIYEAFIHNIFNELLESIEKEDTGHDL